jgi:hypothetical protein
MSAENFRTVVQSFCMLAAAGRTTGKFGHPVPEVSITEERCK